MATIDLKNRYSMILKQLKKMRINTMKKKAIYARMQRV